MSDAIQASLDALDPDALDYSSVTGAVTSALQDADFSAPADTDYVQGIFAMGVITRGDQELLAPVKLDPFGDLQTNVDLGLTELRGGAGDDVLVSGDGPSDLRGGQGDDVLIGGDQSLNGASLPNEAPWEMVDNARYEGNADQYQISKIYVQLNDENRIIAEAATKLSDEYQVAYVVQDTVADELGGEGRDVLVGIERIKFDGVGDSIYLADMPRWEYANWMPTIPDSALPGDLGHSIPELSLWDRATNGSTVDVEALWSGITVSPIEYDSQFGNATVTLQGFAQIQASQGHDVIFGVLTSSAI